ncbi:MAG: T9SS type A sorting domain-containing protein, partial [Candidatus Krumholzibacteriota bacterium]|nr:T9SS type A sorting domain-containing protein [Candidatus Krumholzibacteriota bacterium]
LPTRTVLRPNYPNPFNPSTVIRYDLAVASQVELRIYDVTGALVKVLESARRPAGRYEVVWGGRNERGRSVASGVYFYRLKAGQFTQTRKMILLK